MKELKNEKQIKSISTVITSLVILFLLVIVVIAFKNGYFSSVDEFKMFINSFGIFAPITLVLIQILSVIFPVIPSTVGCVSGVIIFGPVNGFLYNYLGIIIGSIITFGLSKRYGRSIVNVFFSKNKTEKFYTKIKKAESSFINMFTIMLFIPGTPDDVLCYIGGTTKMTWRRFISSLILGKIPSIMTYSLGLSVLFT